MERRTERERPARDVLSHVLDRLDGVSSDRVVGWIAGRNPELLNDVLDEIDAFDARNVEDPLAAARDATRHSGPITGGFKPPVERVLGGLPGEGMPPAFHGRLPGGEDDD